MACYNAERVAEESIFIANPEHFERLTHKGYLIEFVGEPSRFRRQMRQTDEPRTGWAGWKQEQ